MSEFTPVETIPDYLTLDEQEVVAGYCAGFRGDPEPGNQYSRSYWHGHKNGAVDAGHRAFDQHQARLQVESVSRILYSGVVH